MNDKVLKTLEYDKIKERLASCAATDAGRHLCLALKPLDDINKISLELERTTDAVTRIRKKGRPGFGSFKNIIPSVKRLEIGSSLTAEELLEISGVLDSAASLREFLSPENEEPFDSLTYFYESLDECSYVNDKIKFCIISYDEISDNASPALRDIRRKKNQTNLQINRTLQTMITSASMRTYLQDAVITMRNGRYCIPVKQDSRSHVPGMVHDTSGSGSTVFIEPMAVVKLNNELKELDLAEQAEIAIILENLSCDCANVSENIERDYKLLGELDFIFAKALYSEEIGGNAPEFNNDRIIDLKHARHPLLNKKTAVPISVSLGRDFSMLVVTGPNTGGKTVSLKTVGLLSLMGQSGMHIPAYTGSSLCLFKEIYADIGDEQSIEQSLSTFSSHMTNIVKIINEADCDSLVLADELCSGTDPAEGSALAQAILTYLHNKDIRCMATTHYSELKVFAIDTPGVQNACCEFDIETLRPTYRLLIGLPGKSNAFAISSKLGLADGIIEDAKNRMDTSSIAFEDLLAKIESDKKTAEKDLAEAEEKLAAASLTEERLSKEKEAFDSKKKKLLREAEQEAYDVLQSAKDFADLTIKNIRSSSNDAVNLAALERIRTEAGRKAKASLEKMQQNKPAAKKASKVLTEADIVPGLCVKIISMNMEGVVSDKVDSKGKVPVSIGSMNMSVGLSDLEFSQKSAESPAKNAKKNASSVGSLKYSKSLGVSGELKLLGLTVDDALIELDKYIDDACMAHLTSARIVHGKGTGALREAVRARLRKEKRIKGFHQAEYGEGDAGVTIIEFK